MRFSCETKQLLKGVSIISSLCQTKTTKPILQDIKLYIDENEVQLLGTDLEVAVRFYLRDTNIEESGIVVVPAQKLLNMLKEIADERVELLTENRVCSITASDARFKLISDDPDEFPIIPEYDFTDAMDINYENFINYANRTVFSVAKDMSCYAYNGILVELYENGIKLVATDGRRLAVSGNVAKDQENLISSSVVPVKGINQLTRSFDEQTSKLQVKPFKNQFIMRTDQLEVAARLLEGDFPKYRDVVPVENDLRIPINRDNLLSALKKVSITAGNEVRSVHFQFNKGMLRMSSQQEGIGESQVEIPVEYDEKKLEITFNPDFIVEYLKVVHAEEIPFLLRDENSSCLIEESDKDFYIVMPITSK